jgi:hypothetical protein
MTQVWGPCTWYLFHTLAEKIKEDRYNVVKLELINLIKQICRSLPCPDCAGHATSRLQKLNVNAIKNKTDFKTMLLDFHNDVNIKSKKTVFSMTQLNDMYSKANTGNIIQNFINIWSVKNRHPKLMANSLHKNIAVDNFIRWWHINHTHFMP